MMVLCAVCYVLLCRLCCLPLIVGCCLLLLLIGVCVAVCWLLVAGCCLLFGCYCVVYYLLCVGDSVLSLLCATCCCWLLWVMC